MAMEGASRGKGRTVILLWILWATAATGEGTTTDAYRLRELAKKNNVTCVLVFGDSGVDPGNNNRLSTNHRGNFPPYGIDFFNATPTGRFTNGRLVTDFIAEALGFQNIIKAFLDPNLEDEDLLHGVSFASGGSGYDDLTSNITNVISLSKQMEYMSHYQIRLRRLAGEGRAQEIVRNAVVVLSMGTNDFLQNYYVDPTRPRQFTIDQYQIFLISRMTRYIKTLYSLGARRLAVVGMEPFGCMPLVRTLKNIAGCDEAYNRVALSFNSRIRAQLSSLSASLRQVAFVDIYGAIYSALQNPAKYGFSETKNGCCGTGTVEFGTAVRGLSTCQDRSKYVYWDAVHFTEKMYTIIADEAVRSLVRSFS